MAHSHDISSIETKTRLIIGSSAYASVWHAMTQGGQYYVGTVDFRLTGTGSSSKSLRAIAEEYRDKANRMIRYAALCNEAAKELEQSHKRLALRVGLWFAPLTHRLADTRHEAQTEETKMSQTLTMLEFAPDDFDAAQKIAREQGYGDSWAYATSSDMPGLYLLPRHATQPGKVVVKTAEFGLIVVQTFD